MLVPVFCQNADPTFPRIFYDSLPKTCPECGYPMEMSEALTQLHCSNFRCPTKVAQRLVAIMSALGVKDMGEARAEAFVRHFGLTNPLVIFAYEPDVDGPMADSISIDVSKKIVSQLEGRKSFTLPEYIRIANLPFIQMGAFSVFEDFDDLNEAYEKIESGGVAYIQDKLSIKEKGDDSISVRALKIYDTLMTFKEDLISILPYVTIIKTHCEGMQMIKAVCSTEVGVGFRTKADFYATCNNLYPNIHIEFGSSVTKKTDYLVWAGANGSPAPVTNKVKKARAYQEQGHAVKIVTALEFIDILKNLSGDTRTE